MIKGVVIGASRDAVHTIKKAKEHGIYVIALDGNPKADGFNYADESIVVDISNVDNVCKVIEEVSPDFTIPIPIGRYLSTTGFVNDKYDFKGINYAATRYSTDKFLFHKKLEEHGLRNIQMYLVNADTNTDDIDIEYPAILKPRYGSGSRDIFFVNSDIELEKAIVEVRKREEDFIAEQAVEGTEYSIDGAVINGKLEITLLRKKIITPIPVRQPISSFAVVKDEEGSALYARVQAYMRDVVKALEYNNCLVNADLIINDREVFAIEAAPRPSGHNLHNVFVPLSTKVDIAEEYIKYLLGEPYNFITSEIEQIQIRFFDFNDVRIENVPEEKFLREKLGNDLIMWNCKISEGEHLEKVINGHSIMGRGFFIVRGSNEKELIEKSEWILKQFDIK